jgi:hypothetical protein
MCLGFLRSVRSLTWIEYSYQQPGYGPPPGEYYPPQQGYPPQGYPPQQGYGGPPPPQGGVRLPSPITAKTCTDGLLDAISAASTPAPAEGQQ